jgi:hypothetical protein
MTKVTSAKFDKFVSDAIAICASRVAESDTDNTRKLQINFAANAKTLYGVDYNLDALNGNVHTFNTKDAVIASAFDGKRAFIHEYVAVIFKTARNLSAINSPISMFDIDCVLDHTFKLDAEKCERHTHYVLNRNANTAMRATQKSQAINSLKNFGVLSETAKSVYTFNQKAKAVKHFEKLLNCE